LPKGRRWRHADNVIGADLPPSDWTSYDSVVDAYESAAVPRFAAPARDLVAAVGPRSGASALDVGTGTGLAGHIAREAVGPEGFVVGVDPSVPMLGRAATRGVAVVAAVFPGLPFADGVFDTALANLVLSHLGDCAKGLADVVRALRAGGRFGCTAWASAAAAGDEHQGPQADEIIESSLVDNGVDLSGPPTPPVPSEEPLRDRENLAAALTTAGLADVDVQPRTYHWPYSVDEYLVGREWRPGIRYIRQQTDPRLWDEAHDRVATKLRSHFGDVIRTMGHMWIAVGTKP
jgi:SAM-dependent methyltransferase